MLKCKAWKIVTLAAFFGLSGCQMNSQYDASALNAGEYEAALPFRESDTRVKHVSLISDMDIRTEMESGLMDLSKQYFSPNDVVFRSHTFLDYDELDATDGSRGLLGTLRDGNPNGLNPNANEEFDTGNGVVKGGVILVDIYELDWYNNDKLAGISLGLVVNDKITYNNQEYEITQEKMENYLNVTFSKLVTYMRERFNEVTVNVPIFVAAYELNSDPLSASKGGYVYDGYFDGTNSSFHTLDQTSMIVPSTEFSQADPEMAANFQEYKNALLNVLPDATFVTGEAKLNGGVTQRLDLTVSAHGKTLAEIMAVSQEAKQNLNLFTDTNCAYNITIENDDEVYALMRRSKDSTNVYITTAV